MRILLAVDGSPSSEAAVEEVAARPWEEGSEVRVVSVVDSSPPGLEPHGVSRAYFSEVEKSEGRKAQAAIENAVAKLKRGEGSRSMRVSTDVLRGSPGRAIIEDAEEHDAELIVLGSRGVSAWERALLGSVSNTVAQHAKCSVEIVRPPKRKRVEGETK